MFTHLHVHTQYSILDGAAPIPKLFAKAQEDGQAALAITDHGNMFGVKEFLKTAATFPEVKPIIGCEVYVSPDGRHVRRGKEDQSSNHLILLAKNLTGYKNLVKLSSLAYIEGFYYKPRIDHELLEKYREGLIACSACLAGEVSSLLLQGKGKEAEARMFWYRQLFGDDYYIEIQRHKSKDPALQEVFIAQQRIESDLITLAQKNHIKLIATNDVHFVDADDAMAHDRFICISTNSDVDDPNRMRYTREEYFKTKQEMAEIFADLPGIVENTLEVANKVERYSIDSEPIMPDFPIPAPFEDANAYLRHLTYQGAEKLYGAINETLQERIEFELGTIKNMGFPGYFLIVQDFIHAARNMGVWVGPGRGSAAGSVVAYCLGITLIDPIKYGLLFERFLNPDRISLPDMDIDFSDDGRSKVLQYVEDKYGKDHVSHVVTFGTLGAKNAIRDVARIQGLPLSESERLTKMVPDRLSDKSGNLLPVTLSNCMSILSEFKEEMKSKDPLIPLTLEYALKLEGLVRNTGVHACAIIIGKESLIEHIPLCTAKDKETGEEMLVSQYEGSCIEEVGMLKMDFLGLRTLSILRETLDNIRRIHGIEINLDTLPLDDAKTYELFSRGDTMGVFQFESDGMRKWLSELKPSRLEDLIAMNALYRPGPMEKIPDFIDRKFGRKVIEYDLPGMDEYLSETYGITVYQEQVMLLSQKLAGFTRGEADTLRKAMGKKNMKVMIKQEAHFKEGGEARGHPREKLNKIWKDWVAFAEYAFNKSHSTCYALLGYQTAYLKANYPAPFMAGVLSRNLVNMDEISKYMDECKRMGIKVMGPDINESGMNFGVNAQGDLRFGLGGIKGVGTGAVELIVQEREAKGPYTSVYDFVERVNPFVLNRKVIDGLVYAGAFDSFGTIRRANYFVTSGKDETYIDQLIRYGNKVQMERESNVHSLFGMHNAIPIVRPEPPQAVDFSELELLNKERELVGMYLSAHPLDNYAFEIKHFTTHSLPDAAEWLKGMVTRNRASDKEKEVCLAGLVTSVKKAMTKKTSKPWASFTVEDFKGSMSFSLFGKDFETYMTYLEPGFALFLRCLPQPKFGGSSNEWELKIKNITLLANIKDELVKKVCLTLPIEMITSEFRKEFVAVVKENSGAARLNIKIVDQTHQMVVDFFSRSFRVSMNPGLVAFLERHGIGYTL